jgi:hypothetical protein
MTARPVLTLLAPALVCLALGATTAHAQSAGDEPLPGQRGQVPAYLLTIPDPSREVTVPTEAERSQEEARRAQERATRAREEPPRSGFGQPGYIGPLSTETSTGRMGASGWASPAIDPLGSASTPEQKAGQFGFGFSTEWGVQRRPGSAEAP